MASEIEICNQGLAHLGHTQFIQAFDEGSEEANLCDRFYAANRDTVLREWPWRFAKRIVALSKMTVTPEDWTYQYRYPTDCLFARYLVTGTRSRTTRPAFEVRVDAALHGRIIVTDEDQAKLAYTARVTDTFAFDPTMEDALGWRMAWSLAMPLTKEPKMQDMAIRGYRLVLGTARAQDANESNPDERPESELIRIRE